MLLRGYEFVESVKAADVIIAVDPAGVEFTLFGQNTLKNAAVERREALHVTRIPVACDDGSVLRLATRILAIKGSCDYVLC